MLSNCRWHLETCTVDSDVQSSMSACSWHCTLMPFMGEAQVGLEKGTVAAGSGLYEQGFNVAWSKYCNTGNKTLPNAQHIALRGVVRQLIGKLLKKHSMVSRFRF